MASLAGMLKESGYEVSGSDHNMYPPMSTELQRLGIEVYSGYSGDHLAAKPDLVVIGNALSRGNPEVEQVLDEGIRFASLPEVVREFFIRGRTSIVVAGTHGKTTTTSLLAWIFEYAGLKPNFLVGGIAQNFDRSFQLGGGPHFIIEGDEYDTAFFDKGPKFLHYLPHTVLLNNIEFDHADIYADLEAVKLSFRRLINIIPRKGGLVSNADDPVACELSQAAFCAVEPFRVEIATNEKWNSREGGKGFSVRHSGVHAEGTAFTVFRNDEWFGDFDIPLFGDFNVSNAVAAITTAFRFNIHSEIIADALRNFQSVRRRMEIRGKAGGVTIIDDFGHHPTALQKTLQGIRARFPTGRLWAVVEPRSATMRRRISEEPLARALVHADEAILSEVFALDKIPPNERLSPARVVGLVLQAGKSARFIATTDSIVDICVPLTRPGDVVVVFSNGGFDNIHDKFLERLRKENRSA